MFKMSDETKMKILEFLFVIEDDGDRYKEIEMEKEQHNLFQRLKVLFER